MLFFPIPIVGTDDDAKGGSSEIICNGIALDMALPPAVSLYASELYASLSPVLYSCLPVGGETQIGRVFTPKGHRYV